MSCPKLGQPLLQRPAKAPQCETLLSSAEAPAAVGFRDRVPSPHPGTALSGCKDNAAQKDAATMDSAGGKNCIQLHTQPSSVVPGYKHVLDYTENAGTGMKCQGLPQGWHCSALCPALVLQQHWGAVPRPRPVVLPSAAAPCPALRP